MGGEVDGNDRIHSGSIAAGHFFGLADEEIGMRWEFLRHDGIQSLIGMAGTK
jgi:hypothetical protein